MPTDEPLGHGFPPATADEWRRVAAKALKGEPFESLTSTTAEGIPVEPLYTPVRSTQPIAGRAPGTRWNVMQRIDQLDPASANDQALEDLAGGADGLSLVFAGAPSAHGFGLPAEEGAIAHVLDGIDLWDRSLRVEPHPAAGRTAAWLRALIERRRLDPARLDVSFGLDPIGCFARWGALPFAWPDIARRLSQGGRGLVAAGFSGRIAEADGRVWHEAGATNAGELGAVLATAIAYLRAFADNDLNAADALSRIGVTLAADQVQIESMVKLRAFRLLWARLCEVLDVPPSPAWLHVETSRRMMSASDPHTNIVRATIAAVAAGTAGADSLAVLPFTAALGLADAHARRLARNTQLVLIEESNLHRIADPAAGSGALEALTDALCGRAWAEFQAIEREGGIVRSLDAGAVQTRIAQAKDAFTSAYAKAEAHLVGVTIYPNPWPVEVAVEPAERRPEPAFERAAARCRPLPPIAVESTPGAVAAGRN